MPILWGTQYPTIELQKWDGSNWVTATEIDNNPYQFTNDDEVDLKIYFEKVLDGDRYVTESGKVIEYLKGWRLVVEIGWRIFDRKDLTEFLRNAYNWHATDKRIVVYPRPATTSEYGMSSYVCIVDKDWDFDYPEGKWFGHTGRIRFISTELLDNIPEELLAAA